MEKNDEIEYRNNIDIINNSDRREYRRDPFITLIKEGIVRCQLETFASNISDETRIIQKHEIFKQILKDIDNYEHRHVIFETLADKLAAEQYINFRVGLIQMYHNLNAWLKIGISDDIMIRYSQLFKQIKRAEATRVKAAGAEAAGAEAESAEAVARYELNELEEEIIDNYYKNPQSEIRQKYLKYYEKNI